MSRIAVMHHIELVHDLVLKMEDLQAKLAHRQQSLPAGTPLPDDVMADECEARQALLSKLIKTLKLRPDMTGADPDTSSPFTGCPGDATFLLRLLTPVKGKRVFGRCCDLFFTPATTDGPAPPLPWLTTQVQRTLLCTIFHCLLHVVEYLDIVIGKQEAPHGAIHVLSALDMARHTELFITRVLTPLVSFIAATPLTYLCDAFRFILEKRDIFTIAKSKVVTMVIMIVTMCDVDASVYL